jgi:hypothetical protein
VMFLGGKMKKAFDCDFISIPNIVPLKEFVKTPLKKNGPEIFLFVGDLLPKKNPMNLLQAFCGVLQGATGFRITLHW